MSTPLHLFPARIAFCNPDGTLTPEAYRALQTLLQRVGGPLGDNGVDVFGDQTGTQDSASTDTVVQPIENPALLDTVTQPIEKPVLLESVIQPLGVETLMPDVVQPASVVPAAIPSGTVLQVVTFTSSAAFSTSLTTDVATALTATITPKNTSSRILVVVTANLRATGAGGGNCYVQPKLYRGASVIWDGFAQVGNFGSTDFRGMGGVSYVDSPSSASATTYTLYLNSAYATGVFMNDGGGTSTITLIEIAG